LGRRVGQRSPCDGFTFGRGIQVLQTTNPKIV
jgi:hypothetical protein